jgi:hypothetical protein
MSVYIPQALFPNQTSYQGMSSTGASEYFQLANFRDFTSYQLYLQQQEFYQVMQDWYDGIPLEAVTIDKETGKATAKFPIKINPIKGTCQKHATTVMGVNVDSIRFGGLPFQLIPDMEKPNKKISKTIKDALMKTFVSSALGAQFLTNLLISQYLGGSVLAARWLPAEKRIQIYSPNPKEFFGVPEGTDYWKLREGWIIKQIIQSEAESRGYTPAYGETRFYYMEHWTKENYKVMINGKVLKYPGTENDQAGDNPFKVVPMVYTPHIRTSGFIGDSIITETVKGIIKEINLRMADIGDAVSDDSHSYIAIRNIRGTVQTKNLGDGRPVLDLGGSNGIGNESDPDMFAVNTKSASDPMSKFVGDLYGVYRREVNHPAVADGEDEGSQRSSLTISVRMAPLVAEADMERLNHSVGLSEFAHILLIMMAEKGLNEITKDMIDTQFLVQWQSMLPKDREALTQEAAVRSKNKLGSQRHLMSLFGDINDVDEEETIIKKEVVDTPPPVPFGKKPTSAPVPEPDPTKGVPNGSKSNSK